MNYQYEFLDTDITEPVTLDEAKAWMRIDADYSSEDAIISSLITASRERLELYLNIGLVEHEVLLQWDGYPIKLPFSPNILVASVQKVGDDDPLDPDKYNKTGLNEFTLYVKGLGDNGLRFFYSEAGAVSLWSWNNLCNKDRYDVTYTTGYVDNLPIALKNAILSDVDYMYKNQGRAEMSFISPMALQLCNRYSKNLTLS